MGNMNWLEETLNEASPGSPPKADFHAWRAVHADALDVLQRRAREKPQAGLLALGRRFVARPAAKLAIAAGIAILVAVGIHSFGLSPDGTSKAFADVCRSVAQSSTIQFTVTSGRPGVLMFTGRVYEKGGYLVRTEIDNPEGAAWDTILRDRQSDRTLYLDTRGKRAWHPGPMLRWQDSTTDIHQFFSHFLTAPGYSVEELGEDRIDDRIVVGFHLSKTDEPFAGLDCSVWADAKTMCPVRIAATYPVPQVGIVEQTITSIVFDEPLDDSLFDFEPPGYQMDPPVPALDRPQP